MPEIRPARESDLPRILAITNQAIATGLAWWSVTPETLETRQEWMAERQRGGYPVLVAQEDGEVIGFGSFGQFRPREGYRHSVEHSLYIDPAAQGRGAGKALLTELIALARAGGKHTMIGGIDSTNAASLALHRRFGFTETGRLPQVGRKFDRWLDLVFMQKMLTKSN